ncbi:MAG TPA: adenylate/guanylate cyclase domain-containing protein [Pyrinomonadaceae bacterium]|nr:adenylate/guanylate cyclase domain-containing protein [Pyrinomonadaceae bacterium]
MKILVVDNKQEEFQRFMDLPFAKRHAQDIQYVDSPVGLASIVDANPELRLIVLDMLWEQDGPGEAKEFGADAMRDLFSRAGDVRVVIYSVLSEERVLYRLVPEMMRLGAHDWISKDEPKYVRSFRFERAYLEGRDVLKRPPHRAILAAEQKTRSDVHVAVMFVDMSGFTALTNTIGPEKVLKILEAFYAMVGEAVMKHGGYIDKYIGDAVMSVFGASAEFEDDLFTHVQQSIKAARVIQGRSAPFRMDYVEPVLARSNMQLTDAQLRQIGRFRVGIESGPVEVHKFERESATELTFIGTPVNIASRVINKADPGELWVGKNAHDTAAKHLEVIKEVEVEYKNLPGTFQAYIIAT